MCRGRREWSEVLPDERADSFDRVFECAEERVAKFLICPLDSQKFFQQKEAGSEYANKLQHPYETGALNLILAVERHHGTCRGTPSKPPSPISGYS